MSKQDISLTAISAWTGGLQVGDIESSPSLLVRDPGALVLSRILDGYAAELAPGEAEVDVGFEFEELGDVHIS